jgi:hypothetical protein
MPGVKLTVPRQNPLRKAYVIQALKAIQELMELEGDE